ncbi:MAG TPA: site-2 protease family protein [Vicinamibacterales bacterium]|nr:site-2 protease family protein [Vicinamibacterales bacterium]
MSETPAYPQTRHEPAFPDGFVSSPYEPPFVPAAPPRRFQGRLWVHLLLLGVTLLFTTAVGALHYDSFLSNFDRAPVDLTSGALALRGLWYSVTLLAILGAHEMGHYLCCRYYDVDASMPYFIPAPIPLTGTLGAVIRIREAFPTRTVLFDIGIAGPIAGFVVLVPALFIGMLMSHVVPEPTQGAGFVLGEPLLFQWATRAVLGVVPDGYTVNIHPIVFAAWFGMLATALNLLPFSQLDGGHVTYATMGRAATPISIVTVTAAVVMTFVSRSWLAMTLLMLAMLFFLGPRHPRVIYEYEPLAPGRRLLAVFALVMFVLCFTPVPLEPLQFVGR